MPAGHKRVKDYRDLEKKFLQRRREYRGGRLHERDLHPSPFQQFACWLEKAVKAKVPRYNAMTLATASATTGRPSARMMLLKGFDERGFVFFTNYKSQKAHELAKNPQATIVFYWPELERQVIVSGRIRKISRNESLTYFRTRPRNAQLAVWTSAQSQRVASRAVLENRFDAMARKFKGQDIPLPPFWGGYRLRPRIFEFWQGRENRLNDRLRYRKSSAGRWKIERLQP